MCKEGLKQSFNVLRVKLDIFYLLSKTKDIQTVIISRFCIWGDFVGMFPPGRWYAVERNVT